jgi:hypothetical protein
LFIPDDAVKVLVISVIVFLVALAVHLAVWRVRVPRREIVALLGILCGFFGVALFGLWLWAEFSIWDIVQSSLFLTALGFCYVVGYSALSERSPTLTLISYVSTSGTTGRSAPEMNALFSGTGLISRRLDGLVASGHLRREGSAYRLTVRGRFWARLFTFSRRLLSIARGG